MKLSIQYDELSKIINDKTGHKIGFKYVSNNSIEVSTHIIYDSTKIGVNITLLGFTGTQFKVKASSNMLDKLLSLLPFHKFTKFASMDNGIVTISLDKIDQLEKVLAMIKPTQLIVDEKAINLKAGLV